MRRRARSLRLAAAFSGVTMLIGVTALTVSVPASAQAAPTYAAPTATDAQPRPNDTPVETHPSDVANPCDRTVVRPPGADGTTCMYPFPSNLYTRGTGAARRLNLPLAGMPKNAAGKPISPVPYADSDGFSPGQMLIVPVPGLDNRAAYAKTGSVAITDMERYLSPDAPVVVIDVQTGKRHPIWTEIDVNPLGPQPNALATYELAKGQAEDRGEDFTAPPPPDRPDNTANVNFLIRPATNFINGHRYVVGMRTLRNASGAVIPATPTFAQYRDKGPLSVADPRMERYEKDIFPVLTEAGFARGDLYQAWDFNVASATNIAGRLLNMRNDSFKQIGDATMADRVVQGNAPKFSVNAPTTDAEGVRTITGTFEVPCYISTRDCAPGGEFLYAPDDPGRMKPLQLPGNVTKPTFTCKVPKKVYDSPSLEKVRPSLYGHGLLGSQREVNQGQVKDMIREYGFMYCATDWEGFASPDLPTVLTALADMDRFPAVIDHTQQGELNFLYLARLMIHPQGFPAMPQFQVDKGAGPQTFIDTTRAYYDGNSQGGIYGGTVMAIAPDVDRGVLGVPGINYSTLLRRSVDFTPFSLPLYTAYPSEYERPLLLSIIQILWDRGDPNGYVNQLRRGNELPDTPPHTVMYQVAFGDHQVANVSADVAARSAGAVVHPNPLEPGRSPDVTPVWDVPRISSFPQRDTSAIVYFDTGPVRGATPDDGTPAPPTENVPPKLGKDPHEAPRRSMCGRALKNDFLRADSFVGQPCLGAPYFAFSYNGADGQPGQGDTVQPGDAPFFDAPASQPSPSPTPSSSSSTGATTSPSPGVTANPSAAPTASGSAAPSSPAPTGTASSSPTQPGAAPSSSVSPTQTPSSSASPTQTPSSSASPTGTASPQPSAPASPTPAAAGGGFHPLTPARVLDTRSEGGPVQAGTDRLVSVLGKGGVPPNGVRAVVLNATVTGVARGMDLQVYPSDAKPSVRTSNLNATAGQAVANLITVAVGAQDGRIGLSVSRDSSDVVLDVLGYYDDGSGAAGDGYVSLVPDRRFDSRQSAPVRAGADRVVTLLRDLPAASAAVVSVTALGAAQNADVQVYPTGSRPSTRTSTLNLRRTDTVANLAVVPVDDQGRVSLSVSQGSADVVLDLVGYYAPDSRRFFQPAGPDRIYDSRNEAGQLRAGTDLEVRVLGRGGVPTDGVDAVLVNVTSTRSTTPADLQVYPAGQRPARRTSNLNVRQGRTVAVLVQAKVGRDGSITLSTSQGQMDVVLDVVGYVRSAG